MGRALHLDALLNWAQRLVNLALDKLRKLFGPSVDGVVRQANELVERTLHSRESLAFRMFALGHLREDCEPQFTKIAASDEPETLAAERRKAVDKVCASFKDWDRGLRLADSSVKWGGRLTVVHPPVALALRGLRVMLSGGAFLIGQYYLDSPDIRLPWQTLGVYTRLSGRHRRLI
jgi:hypothetical protein